MVENIRAAVEVRENRTTVWLPYRPTSLDCILCRTRPRSSNCMRIDETLSANLVYLSDHEIGSTIPSDKAMMKIMVMVMIKCLDFKKKKGKNKSSRQR